ncbi:MAG TPA: N-acetylglucosamine-6-phosphate deacetylase [Azospirillaceae bacterium]|nr:N-acetylglucosamine-6-phosphate deacetylase [Azospirillaceae bacterium]
MTRPQLLTGARLFDGESWIEGRALLIGDGRIAGLPAAGEDVSGAERVDLPPGTILAPGFLDLQVNGGGGVLFNAEPTADAALAIAAAHRPFGTTALFPTFITGDAGGMRRAAEAAAEAAGVPGGGVAGLHLEGPFLSPARRGVHEASFVRAPTDADIDYLRGLPARFPRGRVLLTCAPEAMRPGDIARLAAAGIVVAGGHSAAGLERTREAVAEGLSGFTHLFNAMPPIANREPGITLAAMADAGTWAGIIADGVHVHPELLKTALRLKPGRLFLVTDAMPPTGTDAHSFVLDGRTIRRQDGRLVTEDGTLAGADLDMAQAVRNAVALLGLPVEEALRMASLYPARFVGLEGSHGRIAPGRAADLVLLSPELRVRGTWVAGVRHEVPWGP